MVFWGVICSHSSSSSSAAAASAGAARTAAAAAPASAARAAAAAAGLREYVSGSAGCASKARRSTAPPGRAGRDLERRAPTRRERGSQPMRPPHVHCSLRACIASSHRSCNTARQRRQLRCARSSSSSSGIKKRPCSSRAVIDIDLRRGVLLRAILHHEERLAARPRERETSGIDSLVYEYWINRGLEYSLRRKPPKNAGLPDLL